MTTKAPLHKFALVDAKGKTRLTCEAKKGGGSNPWVHARAEFTMMRNGKPTPNGWAIVDRGPAPTAPWKDAPKAAAEPEHCPFLLGQRVRRVGDAPVVDDGTQGKVAKLEYAANGEWMVRIRWDRVNTGDRDQLDLYTAASAHKLEAMPITTAQQVREIGEALMEAAKSGPETPPPLPTPAPVEPASATKDPYAIIRELETELAQVKAHANLTEAKLESLRQERARALCHLEDPEVTGVTIDAMIWSLRQRHMERERISTQAIEQLHQLMIDRETEIENARTIVEEIQAIETLRLLAPDMLARDGAELTDYIQGMLEDLLTAMDPMATPGEAQ